MIATHSIQALIGEAAESLGSGNFKNSYELYLKALNSAIEELTCIDFVDRQYLVTRPDNLSTIFSLARSCLCSAETVANKANVLLVKLPPVIPPKPVAHRATPLILQKSMINEPIISAPILTLDTNKEIRRTDDAAEVKTRQVHFVQQRALHRRSSSPSLSTTLATQQTLAPATAMTTTLPAGLSSPLSAMKSFLSFPVEPVKKATSTWMQDDDDDDDEGDDDEGEDGYVDQEGAWLTQGTIDPKCLVPVQTTAGDHIAPTAHPNECVPSIPQAPLVSIFKSLQKRVDDLQLKSPKNKDELRQLAETKSRLNRVRHIHMAATTVPSVLQFPPALVAYQLTLIDSQIFRHIPSDALLQHSPKTPHQSIVASTDFFNYLTRVIEHSILLPQEASGRAQHINHWVKIAYICHELRNYQTLKAIISALGTPPIQRLKRAWAFVPKKSLTRLEDMSELMSEDCNYGRYRERLQQTDERLVPFLGTFIHDMTYLSALPPQSSSRQRVIRVGRPHPPMLKDPRVIELLRSFDDLQHCTPYPPTLSKSCMKHVNKNRRRKLSYALNIKKSALSLPDDEAGELSMEVQQCLVTQYLLTRPWVAEKTVDELSLLREPPKTVRCNASVDPATTSSPVQPQTHAIRGSSGSLSFATSSGDSSDSRPISLDDDAYEEEEEKQEKKGASFWLFGRKSVEASLAGMQRSPRHLSFEDIEYPKSKTPNTPLLQLPPPFFRKDFWRHSSMTVGPSERSSLDEERQIESTSSLSLCLSPSSDYTFLQSSPLLPRRRSSSSLKSTAMEGRHTTPHNVTCHLPQHPLDTSPLDVLSAPPLVLSESPRPFKVQHSFSFTTL